ncbi:MAG: hypothetical protein IJ978_05010 [Clostridia bacterium]|nr:hypothetical protein [Clostridia bacterium]
MLVGISTATYFTKLVTENSFSVICRNGGKIAEVFLTTYSEFEEDFGHLLNEVKGDVEIYSIHSLSTAFEPQLFNKAERTRKDAEKFFRKVLRVGQIIGAKCYTFHGSTRMKKTQVIDPVFFGKRMKELGDMRLFNHSFFWFYHYIVTNSAVKRFNCKQLRSDTFTRKLQRAFYRENVSVGLQAGSFTLDRFKLTVFKVTQKAVVFAYLRIMQ